MCGKSCISLCADCIAKARQSVESPEPTTNTTQAEIAFLSSISLALAGGYPRKAAIDGVRKEIYDRIAQLSALR
jgi:hypothetical protein